MSQSKLFSRLLSSTPTPRAASSKSPSPTLGGRPFRVGIIGGGPAGFYAASRLLSLPGSDKTCVDIFELLPVPFGLARFGVAPDHPEVKNCEHKFEETARDPRLRYFGNVQISGDIPTPPSTPSASLVPNLFTSSLAAQISLSSLRPHYDALILTYGASLDRSLGIPGEDTLLNVHSARSFVNWYNGHPYHSSLLSPLLDLSKTSHVTLIGQGNVALDVARLLLKPIDELRRTDLPEYALAELARSRVKRVDVIGRRGPLQLASTTKELREMMNLPGVGFEMSQVALDEAMEEVARNPEMVQHRMRKRALGLLKTGSKAPLATSNKSWSLEFLKSPTALLPAEGTMGLGEARVGAVELEVNELVVPASGDTDPSAMQARGTGRVETRKTEMVMKSVGYRSIGLPGLPFDERKGIVLNDQGRVMTREGETIPGLYTSGWLARGPTGVIATTMFDAFATADLVSLDLASLPSSSSPRPEPPIASLSGNRKVVSWEEWEKIDVEERKRGAKLGKVREKITDVEEMMSIIG